MSSDNNNNDDDNLALPHTTEDRVDYVKKVIEAEVKQDSKLVDMLMNTCFSTYTNDPICLMINSRNPGEGKSHAILKVVTKFPEDYQIIHESSDKALFHEKGELVKKDKETRRYVSIEPELLELEEEIRTKELKFAELSDPSNKEKAKHKHEIKELEMKIAKLKQSAIKRINLEGKILVFLDTPNPRVLDALMPLLSHDNYESVYKFTDKKTAASSGGSISSMETRDNLLWGWPTVIFAQTIDMTDRKRFGEFSRRFIINNPEVTIEKIDQAVSLKLLQKSMPHLIYEERVVSDSDLKRAKNMVLGIKNDFLEFSQNLKTEEDKYDSSRSAVILPYLGAVDHGIKRQSMNTVTNTGRFGQFQSISAITHANVRLIFKACTKEPQNTDAGCSSINNRIQEYVIVTYDDTIKAIELMNDASNTGLRPEQRNWYQTVFYRAYTEKPEKSSKKIDGKLVTEDIKGLTKNELVQATYKYWSELLNPKKIDDNYLTALVNAGVITYTRSKIRRSENIYSPVEELLNEGNFDVSDISTYNNNRERNKKFLQVSASKNFLEDKFLHFKDISYFPTKDSIKSEILAVVESYQKREFDVQIYDGRTTKVYDSREGLDELDSVISIYYPNEKRDLCFKVDHNPVSTSNLQICENRDYSQALEPENEKSINRESESSDKFLQEEPSKNLLILERNPASESRTQTKSYNNRQANISELLKSVDKLTKEGKSLLSLALKDSCIAFDCEWYQPEAGGKLYGFSVMDVLTEKPIESIRITDPYIAGNYAKLVKAVVTAIRKRQNKNAQGYVIDDKEILNEQSLGWWTRGKDSDLDKINEACKATGIQSPIGHRGGENSSSPYIIGQEHIDIYSIYRNNLVKSSVFKNRYRALDLSHVGKKVVGLGKYKDLNGLEALGLSLEEQKAYNMRDCEIVAKLAKAKDGSLLALMRVISELLLLPFDKTCHTELPYWWAHLFKSEGSVPSVNPDTGEPYFWDYEGGLVETPPTGLFHNIRVLDVASLYPTMARRYNLSFDTIECNCCKDDPKARVPKDVLISRAGDKPIERNYWVCRKRKGDFPKFLDDLTDLRLQFKHDNKRPEFKAINKMLSDGLKILVNGGYGCFGYPAFEFLDVRVAELVTAYGRYTLRKIMEIASGKYELRVVYGDTDSVFVEGINATNDEQIKLFIEEVNKALNIELEDDKLFKRAIITGKKHYLGVYYDSEKNEDEIIVRGMEGSKSDRPAFINRMWEKFVDDFEADVNPWTAIASELKRLVSKEMPPDDFKIEIQISKNPSEYSQSLVQYKVGTLMNAKKGDLIWFYKIHNGNSDRAKALEKKDGGFIAYQNPDNISYEKALDDVERTFSILLEHLEMNPEELFKSFREEVPKDNPDPLQNTLEGGFGETT